MEAQSSAENRVKPLSDEQMWLWLYMMNYGWDVESIVYCNDKGESLSCRKTYPVITATFPSRVNALIVGGNLEKILLSHTTVFLFVCPSLAFDDRGCDWSTLGSFGLGSLASEMLNCTFNHWIFNLFDREVSRSSGYAPGAHGRATYHTERLLQEVSPDHDDTQCYNGKPWKDEWPESWDEWVLDELNVYLAQLHWIRRFYWDSFRRSLFFFTWSSLPFMEDSKSLVRIYF